MKITEVMLPLYSRDVNAYLYISLTLFLMILVRILPYYLNRITYQKEMCNGKKHRVYLDK